MLLDEVRALPEVEAAGGTVAPDEVNAADIIGDDGKAVAKESLGMSFDAANARFSPLRLKTGDWPQGRDQVVIDAGTAAKEHYAVGDDVAIATAASAPATGSPAPPATATWTRSASAASPSGTSRPRSACSTARAATTPSRSPRRTARRRTSWSRAVAPLVPDELEVKDSAQQAEDDAAQVNKGMKMIRLFLLGFGLIALLVGAFVIFNTLSITVAQRTREFATLRTLGASRKQVMRSVVIEGLVIGLVASVLGILAGFGISEGMIPLFSALGVDLPDAPTVVALRTIVVSLLLGTGVTLLASVLPARRATRVPPISAVREGALLPTSRAPRLAARASVVAARLARRGLARDLRRRGGRRWSRCCSRVGVLGLFAGHRAARAARSSSRSPAWWAGRRSGSAASPGELAGANAVRNPGRTASTAAALMIGLCLVTVVAVLGSGLKATTANAVSDQLRADHVIDGKQGLPFRASEGDALAGMPGVTAVSHVRSDTALVQGEEGDVSGSTPRRSGTSTASPGRPAPQAALDRLGADDALVTQDYADAQDVTVGGKLSPHDALGRGAHARRARDPRPAPGQAAARPGHDDAGRLRRRVRRREEQLHVHRRGRETGTALAAAAEDLGDATYHTGAEYPTDATKELSTMLPCSTCCSASRSS